MHEWWGITKHMHNEARRFAQNGYTVFIADNPKDAGMLAGRVMKNPPAMQSRFNAARAQLAKHASVDAKKIGAAGTNTPAPQSVKTKVLVLNGADDPLIKPEQIEAFKKDMDAAKADYRYMPVAYNAKVDKEAKAEADKFFAAALKK